MRLLFFILLLVNAGILGYFMLLHKDSASGQKGHPPLHSEAIRLYNDAGNQGKRGASELKGACLEWSGLTDANLEKAQLMLEEIGLKDRIALPTALDYWVHIPPLKNEQEAEKKLGELKTLGVDDGAIVDETGKWRFAISLAAFASKSDAEFHLKQLRDKGIRSAKLVERRPASVTLTLLGVGPNQLSQLQGKVSDFEKSELKNVDCSVK